MATRANYLALDRPDIAFAATECCRRMSDPCSADMAKLKHLVRYLVGRPRLVYDYPWSTELSKIDVHTDSDFAGCKETRKSTSGGALRIGPYLVKHWASTQKVIALSSGEAELYGTVRACAEAIGLRSLMRDLGIEMPIDVWTDSTAAKGIATRKGVGKVRHIDVSFLWLQDKVADQELMIHKVLGTQNPADIFTKNVNRELIDRYCQLVGIQYLQGRAQSAPSVD